MNIEPIVIVGGLFAIAVVAILVISMRNDKEDAKPQEAAKWETPAPTVRVIPKTEPKKKAPVKKTSTAAAAKKPAAKKAPAKKAAPKKK